MFPRLLLGREAWLGSWAHLLAKSPWRVGGWVSGPARQAKATTLGVGRGEGTELQNKGQGMVPSGQ